MFEDWLFTRVIPDNELRFMRFLGRVQDEGRKETCLVRGMKHLFPIR